MNRKGEGSFGKVLWAMLVLGVLYAAAMVYPPYLAYWEMKEVVQVVLLEWRDSNKARAVNRLKAEVKKRDLPIYWEDCEFWTERKEKHLDCWWEVVLEAPGYEKRMEFTVHKYLDPTETNVWDYEG